MKLSKIFFGIALIFTLINLNNILNLLPFDPTFIVIVLIVVALSLVVLLSIIILAITTDMKILDKLHAKPYPIIQYKNIEVNYLWRLNGGGIILAYEFVHIVSQKIGKVGHVFEYCAGPGFIGFSLLANNLCDRLTLSDVNPKAIEVINETIRMNNLQDRVTVYQSDCLDSIPESEQWDLVVGNPPWHLHSRNNKNIRVHDSGGAVHAQFYQGITKFLKPNGSILFVEGAEYTTADQFKDMIEENGLKVVESFRSVPFLDIFKKFHEYKGMGFPLVMLLRLGLSLRKIYFILSKKHGPA